MDDLITRLLIKNTKLWVCHMEIAYEDEPDEEIREELRDLLTLLGEVECIYNAGRVKLAPIQTIKDFILALEPDQLGIEVSVFSDNPQQFLISTLGRLKRSTSDALTKKWGGSAIVLNRAPLR